ncbi:hypothetical protein [Variovorax gossypii]
MGGNLPPEAEEFPKKAVAAAARTVPDFQQTFIHADQDGGC